MSRKAKLILLIMAVATLAAAALLLWMPGRRIQTYDSAFADIARGTTEAQVIQAMGRPHETAREGFWPYWDDEPLSSATGARVKFEYRYQVNTLFLPITWTIGFDDQHVVVAKHRWD